jgi:STE24 endopeptidase
VKRFALARVLADVAAGAAACGAASVLSIAAVAGGELAARAAAVLAVLVAIRACLQPVLNATSRRQELQADRRAIEITGNADAFVAAYRKLAARRGAMKDPPRWAHLLFSGSPTLTQRLAVAKERP